MFLSMLSLGTACSQKQVDTPQPCVNLTITTPVVQDYTDALGVYESGKLSITSKSADLIIAFKMANVKPGKYTGISDFKGKTGAVNIDVIIQDGELFADVEGSKGFQLGLTIRWLRVTVK